MSNTTTQVARVKSTKIADDPNVNVLTEEETKAVLYSITSSIDLYRGYVKLNPEDKKMERKQKVTRKRMELLVSAKKKLK